MGSPSTGPFLHDLPILFLGVSTIGALFAFNAYRPISRGGVLSIYSFFAGWLTAELPVHHLIWQLVLTIAFLHAGAFAAWPGWLGLGITLASWVGLLYLAAEARRARAIVQAALGGDPFDVRIPLLQLLVPFASGRREVKRVRDIPYGPYGRRNHLDVYHRRDEPRGSPVLIQVHGGAWVLGTKEQQGLPLIHRMASAGWVCVSINYRLSPRSTFPDHVVDVKRAIAWVKANIARYGGDPDFVVITGGSAGGHLSSLAALTPNDPEYQPGFEEADTSVRACVPFYGVYDFTDRKGLSRRDLRRFLEKRVVKRSYEDDPGLFDRASPMSRITEDAPPFFVVHGTNDTLVPVAEARLFVELLRARSRQRVVYVELPWAQHAFEVFGSVRAAHVIEGVARFLDGVHGEYVGAHKKREDPAAARAPRGEAYESVEIGL